jgi:putative hydrolase of the HAD superfamily
VKGGEAMIRNIVFDMGNVLIRFDPDSFMDQVGITDPEDRKIVNRELFASVEWALMDMGLETEDTFEPKVLARIPNRLREKVRGLLRNWAYPRQYMPGMPELVQRLKQAGYRIYLLSNASKDQPRYWNTFPVSRLFEGTLISCDAGIVKPDPRIYRLFTERFSLQPAECLFIDDQPPNVAAAIRAGWSGIVFQGSAEDLRERIAHLLKNG